MEGGRETRGERNGAGWEEPLFWGKGGEEEHDFDTSVR